MNQELMFDEVQSHILGVVVSLMSNYNLDINQVNDRLEYVKSLETDPGTTYVEYKNKEVAENKNQDSPQQEIQKKRISWADEDDSELVIMENIESDSKTSVRTRKEFCHAMSNNIKICPSYTNCSKEDCTNFHINPQYICPHYTKGSYCDHPSCELIVIRPCRKGKRCNDAGCSFRH